MRAHRIRLVLTREGLSIALPSFARTLFQARAQCACELIDYLVYRVRCLQQQYLRLVQRGQLLCAQLSQQSVAAWREPADERGHAQNRASLD